MFNTYRASVVIRPEMVVSKYSHRVAIPPMRPEKLHLIIASQRLMYGTAESWALTEAQGAQLETFHNGCLRQMMGLHRGPDGSTAELLARTGQANMADHMRRHRVTGGARSPQA